MRDYKNSPEPELVRWAKQGDVDAFSQLYAGIYKDLYHFALYTTRHRQDAEDAVGEAVAAAYENMAQLKKEESFRAWMFTILNNCCRKILRRQQKDAAGLNDIVQMQNRRQGNADGAEGNIDSIQRHTNAARARRQADATRGYADQDYAETLDVRAAFGTLEEEERLILAFSVFGGYRSEEIGAIMEKNAATVRSRKSRALEKMRRMLT